MHFNGTVRLSSPVRLSLSKPIWLVLSLFTFEGMAQRTDSVSNEIKVLARTSVDSIILRWAPMQMTSWLEGNKFGYTIERYVLVRDNKVLTQPEKKVLTVNPIKPFPLDRWEPLVKRNKYAAIAAQSLYGTAFELTTQGTDVFQIVNKVKENEQRFSFALFSADMSAPVSIALGLRFTDREVKKGEKYLYRIRCISTQPTYDTLKGSIFIEPEKYELPKPLDLTAQFKGKLVSLKWDQSYHKGIYSAYSVERSSDGNDFKALSDDPLVTLSDEGREESRYQYATDSLPNAIDEYHYRVRGLTPFGELGPPSETVKGRGSILIGGVPHILEGVSENNKTIKLSWEFSDESNIGISGFQVHRSETPKSLRAINAQSIGPKVRFFEDISPNQTNYYQVVAIALNGEEFRSPVYYAQLIDSIPPSPPSGLKGVVSDKGTITILWTPNTEQDIYGYRIYRGNYLKEEFSQITIEPIQRVDYTDSVNLKTLNHHIYYQLLAIDRNQNYSVLSEVLSLELPDKVKPVSPFFLPVSCTRDGVGLTWTPSSSDDVIRYDVYRKEGSVLSWIKIGSVKQSSDTLFYYTDQTSQEGLTQFYTIVAIDKAGLESDAAQAVSGTKLLSAIKPPVVISDLDVDRTNKKIVLTWSYDQQGVERYQVYRSKESEPLKLYSTIIGSNPVFEDKQVIMNSNYTYRVLALFVSGAKSEFSKEIKVKY